MSAGDFSNHVVAFQAIAHIETYEQSVEELVREWFDPELYAQVSREMDTIKLYCGSLPSIGAPWVTVLISHAELMFNVWQLQSKGGGAEAEAAELLEQHLQTVRFLKQRCERLLKQQHA